MRSRNHSIMEKIALLFILLTCHISYFSSQVNKSDSTNQFGLHLGVNYGGGNAGGLVGGGLLKVCPRIGINYKERFVLGLEANADYQIVYRKDTVMDPSIRLSKWIGPFVKYYFRKPEKKWNVLVSANYIYGSYYSWNEVEKFRTTYRTVFLGLGASYRIKNTLIEAGYRHTFLMNNTPIMVRWTNSIFLGLSWDF